MDYEFMGIRKYIDVNYYFGTQLLYVTNSSCVLIITFQYSFIILLLMDMHDGNTIKVIDNYIEWFI